MIRATRRHRPAAALLALALATPAAADELRELSVRQMDGWAVSMMESTTATGRLRWCRSETRPAAGTLGFNLWLTATPGPTPVVQAALGVYNTAWQLGPTSAGTAVVSLGGDARNVPMHRTGDIALLSATYTDEATLRWIRAGLSRGVTVQLPNSPVVTITPSTTAVGEAALACMMTITSDTPPPVRDPFAAPAPPARPPTDPFAPAR